LKGDERRAAPGQPGVGPQAGDVERKAASVSFSVTPGQVETGPCVNLRRAIRQEVGKMAMVENLTTAAS